MAEPLWSVEALVAACAGHADGAVGEAGAVTGISIDTRTLVPGDLFVALKDQRDGHEFVSAAFEKGAAAALVHEGYARQSQDGLLIRVDDVLTALERIGVAARARLDRNARVIAITGSAGKTTTKEMLRLCLTPLGATHASDKSFNNHWGVPLTLARMPRDTRFAVFEIGMNHAGEITPLTQMVRPDIAMVTTVEAAHLAAFASVEDIARAKAEIMSGLEPGGFAVLNRDNPHYGILRQAAVDRAGVNVVSFGVCPIPQGDGAASVRLLSETASGSGTRIAALTGHGIEAGMAGEFAFELGAAGHHMVLNALGVAAILQCAGVGMGSVAALAGFGPPQGRGSRQPIAIAGGEILLIDESYNANPASMRAALMAMALLPRQTYHRRIAVLGDMLELGSEARQLHEGLADALSVAEVDCVYAAGANMQYLFAKIPKARQGAWAETSADLEAALSAELGPGDAVMIKGSNGSRMGRLVELVRGLERDNN
ncbi:MAG: UDP-N-acetylmuramoyl-tripeptide--D-alanyl-D-alanine ligase [Hyphomicrobiaceae bacterium]|nr:UDP-N-acetylmuramoyl-tripeptide--D-alanyl-D-alanine ligase [Hyphomicrobiaceae bacterium]